MSHNERQNPHCARPLNLPYYGRIFRKKILSAALLSSGGEPRGEQMNKLITAACCAWCVVGVAAAQNYPTKTIRIIVPYPAGGTSDILARLLSAKLNDVFGQTVIVDNRPGANGNIGADLVAKSPPDGYTLLLADLGALTISPSIYKLPFDVVKDFAPVTMVTYSPHLLAVHPAVPVKTVKELVALAKSKPGLL